MRVQYMPVFLGLTFVVNSNIINKHISSLLLKVHRNYLTLNNV